MSQAAKDLGVTLPHLYRVATGERESATLSRRIAEWKAAHLLEPEDMEEARPTQPTLPPATSQAIGLSQAERMLAIRALLSAAEKWRGFADSHRFESEGLVWAADAANAEKLCRKLAQ
ncbi:MAG: hypothetical protein DVB22_002566 [Verrucomicrobia bacterium]|nr:MAG: hypothetical protein DVB22_002566 [Verrucomicrobiota bacterium]